MALVVIWWLCISSGGETKKNDFLSQIYLEGQGGLPTHPHPHPPYTPPPTHPPTQLPTHQNNSDLN